LHLSPVRERSKRSSEDANDTRTKLDGVQKLDAEDGTRVETVSSQEEDKVGWR